MKPVDQDQLNPPPKLPLGNCFAACVASLLEVGIGEVLDDSELLEGKNWWPAWLRWLSQRGYGLLHISNNPPAWFFPVAGYSIMSGKSPRGNFGHSVVALDGVMIHDPHPSRAGLDGEPRDWVIIYPKGVLATGHWEPGTGN